MTADRSYLNPKTGKPRTAEEIRKAEAMTALIDEATADEPEGKAAWARALLLEAARRKVERERRRKKQTGKDEPPMLKEEDSSGER